MAQKNSIAPRLPTAPVEYNQQFMDMFINVLRLYFNQLDNASPILLSSQGIGTAGVISGLTFATPNPANPGVSVISLPTQADLSNLKTGDVYYDTSGGTATSYPLRIKA
jgi:hypothetical protein